MSGSGRKEKNVPGLSPSTSSLTEENLRRHNEEQLNGSAKNVLKELKSGNVDDRPASRSNQSKDNPPDEISVELPKPKAPLPPISTDNNLAEKIDRLSGKSSPVNSISTSSTLLKNSMPKIMAFKREVSEEEMSVQSTDSFNKQTNKTKSTLDTEVRKPESLAFREVSMAKRFDGQLVTFVSIDTQTDWSWTQTVKEVETLEDKQRKDLSKKEESRNESKVSEQQSKEELKLKSTAGSSRPKSRQDIDKEELKATEMAEDLLEVEVEPATAYPSREDEYGIPLLELSDIESSDENDAEKEEKKGLLPSIGPPEIIKYIKETEKQRDPNVIIEEDEEGMEQVYDSEGRPLGIFAGICEFCEQTIKPFPSMEQQKLFPPEQLFCCDDYRQFVQFALTIPESDKKEDEIIDVKPHPPYGSKMARKAAKERAVLRLREREIQRAQAAASGMAPANFYSFARQMKTINYQLSSQKCLDEGWTVRVPSPTTEEPTDLGVFEQQPVEFTHISAAPPGGLPMEGTGKNISVTDGIVEKYYHNKKKFMTIFPDGTGCVYYPSGNLAITVTSLKKGQFSYVIQADMDEFADIMAVFEPTGLSCCYYSNKSVRIYLDQFCGIELDIHGAKKKRWLWKDDKTHVHAPPFQPICFALNSYISVRMIAQHNIGLTFNTKSRSCRFNVGANLKLVAPQFIPPEELNEDKLYMEETIAKVHTLLNRVSNLLKFPKSPKLDKMPAPQHVTMKLSKIDRLRQSRNTDSTDRKDVPTVVVS